MRIGAGGSNVKSKKGAGIIFTDGKSMLLLKRSEDCDHPETWAPPGGGNKNNETDIRTAIRETHEECGIESTPGYRFNSLTTKNGHHKFATFFYYVDKPFDVKLSHEHTESKWVDFSAISDMDLHPKFKEHLAEYLKIIRKKLTNFNEWSALTETINKIA